MSSDTKVITEQTLERIRSSLREARDIGGSVPQDLYTHLTEVFNRVLVHASDDAYDRFEEISALVKQTDLKFKDPKNDKDLNAAGSASQSVSERDEWVRRSKNLLNEVNDLITAQDRHLLTKGKSFAIPNFTEEAEMLDWAGINFGEDNTLRLSKSIKRLAIMSGADSVRFAGKIFGTQSDYWVAMGKLAEPEEDSKDASVEARGKGVNETVFWVTDNLLSDWIQLPDCRPNDIKQARQIKHIFTGDLNANVDTNPAFTGKERHLLRATLARIFHATQIVPKGLYAVDEETNEVRYGEEFAFPKTEELRDIKVWGNVHQIILEAGRVTHQPLNLPEEELGPAMEELEAKDPTVERFRDIGEHALFPAEQPCWISKVVGDTQQYADPAGGEEGNVSFAVNILKSLRWPGAVTVSKGGKCCSVYVGHGLKKGDPSYNPIEPPTVQEDPEEEEEKPEPNPLTEPPIQDEEDTMQEDKPEGEDD